MNIGELRQRQSLPLEMKVRVAQIRIRQWYEHHDGQVYVAFSGGKDSTVLRDLVLGIYPDTPCVFADTGLEFPEIRQFAKDCGAIFVRPVKTFKQVIDEYGYPVVSKKTSKMIGTIRRGNVASTNLYLHGIKSDGTKSDWFRLPKKYQHLIDAPFKISEKCCDILKKNPMKVYEKETGRKAYVGIMASDSRTREQSILKTGCNAYSVGLSYPLSCWNEQDVWDYIRQKDLPYCSVYDQGEERTGCIFCLFGCQFDPGRIERLRRYPDLYKYCIETLKLDEILAYVQKGTSK